MIRELFSRYQKDILSFANTELGKDYLGIKTNLPIVKFTPNSYHLFDGKNFQATFSSHPKWGKIFASTLTMLDIAKDSVLDYSSGFQHYLSRDLQTIESRQVFPQIYLASGDAIYPNSGGSGSVRGGSTANWQTSHDANPGDGLDQSASVAFYSNGSSSNSFIRRVFLPFDTSGIGATMVVSAAVLSIWPTASEDGDTDYVRMVITTQTDPTALAVADYAKQGTTAIATDKLISSFVTTGQYNTMALTNLAVVSLTDYTKIGLRCKSDAVNSAPTNANSITMYMPSQAGTTNDPKLVVTYALPGGGMMAFFQ